MKHLNKISNSIPIKTEDLETIAYVAFASGATKCADNILSVNYLGILAGVGKIAIGDAAAVVYYYRHN